MACIGDKENNSVINLYPKDINIAFGLKTIDEDSSDREVRILLFYHFQKKDLNYIPTQS